MLTNDKLPPLPKKSLLRRVMPDDFRYGDVFGYTADQIHEYGRAVERAAYAAAIKECEPQITGSDYHFLATHGHWDHMAQAATNCAAAIRALGSQHD